MKQQNSLGIFLSDLVGGVWAAVLYFSAVLSLLFVSRPWSPYVFAALVVAVRSWL